MTPLDRYNRDVIAPLIADILGPDRDEPLQNPSPPTPCGAHCADRDGALCGYHDAECEAYEESKLEEARNMTRSAEQLYDHGLIDAGAAGQSFARILATVFRGEIVPVSLIEQARETFAQDMLEYLMKGGK